AEQHDLFPGVRLAGQRQLGLLHRGQPVEVEPQAGLARRGRERALALVGDPQQVLVAVDVVGVAPPRCGCRRPAAGSSPSRRRRSAGGWACPGNRRSARAWSPADRGLASAGETSRAGERRGAARRRFWSSTCEDAPAQAYEPRYAGAPRPAGLWPLPGSEPPGLAVRTCGSRLADLITSRT